MTGVCSRMAQVARSTLWTSDWTTSSPESQAKWYWLLNWYCDLVLVRLAVAEPVRPAEKVLLDGHDIADGPVVDAFHGLQIAGLVSAMQAGHDAQFLLFGQLAGGRDLADAHRVDGVRLFHEHVLAGLDRRGDKRDGTWPHKR